MDAFQSKLVLAPGLSLVQAADSWLLLGEDDTHRVTDSLHVAVLSRVRTPSTGEALMAELGDEFGGAEVLYCLSMFHARGIVIASGDVESPQTFWGPPSAVERLGSITIEPVCVEPAVGAAVCAALTGAGLALAPRGDLQLVVARDYLDPRLLDALRRAYSVGQAALPVALRGRSVWLGPSFESVQRSSAPCWRCLQVAVARNRPVHRLALRDAAESFPPARTNPTSLHAATAVVAMRIADLLSRGQLDVLQEGLWSVDLATFEAATHAVRRRPQCSACGDSKWMEHQMLRPVVLDETVSAVAREGGVRLVSAAATYERLRSLVDERTGVVASLGPLREKDHPLRPVYAASYFVSPVSGGADATETFSRTSLGKGKSAAQARTSALCEAVERYAAIWQGDEPTIRKSFRELGAAAVDPCDLQNFSERQYSSRDELKRDRRERVPLRFDADQVIDWAPAWSMTQERIRWIPARYCFTNTPTVARERISEHNPNGHAAGNCLEEAILQGFLELVERDASAIWWYNRLQRPRVDLYADDGYFARTVSHYAGLGYGLHVLALTHDLEIPAMVAIAHSATTGRIFMGFGCHWSSALAVERAVTELHQVFDPTGERAAPWLVGDFVDPSFLFPWSDTCQVETGRGDQVAGTLADQVRVCVSRAHRAGLETLVVNYSRPDIDLHTVKVIVPGLRHFWPRFGQGRLYDVPVWMGWRGRPLLEEELNPVPLLL